MNVRRTALAVAIGVAAIAILLAIYEEWYRRHWADAWTHANTVSGTE